MVDEWENWENAWDESMDAPVGKLVTAGEATDPVFLRLLGRGGGTFLVGDLGRSSEELEAIACGRLSWKLCCNWLTFPRRGIKGEMLDWNGGISTTTKLSSVWLVPDVSFRYSNDRC
ncbi:hypothetical protein OGAPHI_006919 [Ogataea philodendri]|uniref:Uncharacterized protein n=1 Tax=Ogataea philodendri TaxID=1378263 RepID=A0A9P8SZ39_9ASCO|nr:uncharacterized protein OGAPHI_006919 [Ogataea philodendri]KAH3660333.1 hypothetical protein OGAPHI_006919 [Ogataea philodendri]